MANKEKRKEITEEIVVKALTTSRFAKVLVVLLVIVTACIIAQYHYSTGQFIRLGILALIAGLILESKRLTEKWSVVFTLLLIAYVLSFVGFFNYDSSEIYSFNDKVETWPYFFIFIFIIGCIGYNYKKVTTPLTDGITLLQSIAIIYWVVDHGFTETDDWFLKILMGLGLLFSLFAMITAFASKSLSRRTRLILSVWSSIIMLLFAADNISEVYQNKQIEEIDERNYKFYVALQYFLLGTSAIYMVQNFLLFYRLLPPTKTDLVSEYPKRLKVIADEHVARYSETPVSRLSSLMCILFSGSFFYLNSRFQILSADTAIWIVFFIFPFIVLLPEYLNRNEKEKSLTET